MTDRRLSAYVPGRLDVDQQAVYDAVASSPRASGFRDYPLENPDGSLAGPFNALVAAGRLGGAVQEIGVALRFHGALPAVERELVILDVARHFRCDFEFYAHERIGRRAGLDEEVIEALARDDEPSIADPRQRVVYLDVAAPGGEPSPFDVGRPGLIIGGHR